MALQFKIDHALLGNFGQYTATQTESQYWTEYSASEQSS